MKNVYLLILISVIFIGFVNYYLYLFSKKKGIFDRFKNLLVYFLSSFLIFVFLDFYVFKLFGHGFHLVSVKKNLKDLHHPMIHFLESLFIKITIL